MTAERTAADVFGLLSDETRLDILRAVASAQSEEQRTGVARLSFSEVYDRVDVDNTSKLSYHLGELTGTFLRKHEAGYAFTYAGEQLVRFVLAENYRTPPAFEPVETSGQCHYCGAPALSASLQEQYFFVRCGECDRPAFSYRVRPAQVRANSGTDLVDAVITEQTADFRKMRRGLCPDCAGQMGTEVVTAEAVPIADTGAVSFATLSECRQCLRFLSIPLTHAAAYHPASVAFHWERGVDVMDAGLWEFHRHLHEGRWRAAQTATDPETYRVELARDDDVLRLFLDEHASVIRTKRVRRRDCRERRT